MVKNTLFQLLILAIGLYSCESGSPLKMGGVKNQFYDKMGHLPNVPVKMEFCEEVLSFHADDLKERLDAEIIAIQNEVANTTLILKRTKRYFPLIDSILNAHHLPLDLKYLAVCESGLNPIEIRNDNAGIWQLSEHTARENELLVNDQIDERLNVIKSTEAFCASMKKCYADFKDWPTRIIAFNRGANNVRIALRNQQTETYFDTQFSAETSRYIFRILAIMLVLETPDDYGFRLTDYDYYYPLKVRRVKLTSTVGNLKHWAVEKGINYKILRVLNPWILRETLPNGRTFDVNLPNELSNLKPYGKDE